jgi:small subunit ribosomal protein S14
VAKVALIERELKREKLAAKFAKKYAELKAIANDAKRSDEERAAARLGLQKLPRNANPTRQRNRCEITGRPRGTFRQFGLGRAKIRELAFAGHIPGVDPHPQRTNGVKSQCDGPLFQSESGHRSSAQG